MTNPTQSASGLEPFEYDGPAVEAYSPSEDELKAEVSPRVDVLREAAQLIDGDRNVSYGSPTQNFTNIAAMWNVRFAHILKDGQSFTAADVADAMVLLKVARNIASPKRDNMVDIAGYAACGWEARESEEKQASS